MSPELFSSPSIKDGDDGSARRMAMLYVQGERLRDYLWCLTRDSESGQPNRAVFDRLVQMQVAAVDLFEEKLIQEGNNLASTLNADLWSANPLDPRLGKLLPYPSLAIDPELTRVTDERRGYLLPDPTQLTIDEGKERELFEKTVPRRTA